MKKTKEKLENLIVLLGIGCFVTFLELEGVDFICNSYQYHKYRVFVAFMAVVVMGLTFCYILYVIQERYNMLLMTLCKTVVLVCLFLQGGLIFCYSLIALSNLTLILFFILDLVYLVIYCGIYENIAWRINYVSAIQCASYAVILSKTLPDIKIEKIYISGSYGKVECQVPKLDSQVENFLLVCKSAELAPEYICGFESRAIPLGNRINIVIGKNNREDKITAHVSKLAKLAASSFDSIELLYKHKKEISNFAEEIMKKKYIKGTDI